MHGSRFPVPPYGGVAFDPSGILTPDDKPRLVTTALEAAGIGPDRCVAFGDSMSDAPLFRALSHTVAVNADDHLLDLAAATYTGDDLWAAYELGRVVARLSPAQPAEPARGQPQAALQAAQLGEVGGRERRQVGVAIGGQLEVHDASIVGVGPPLQQPGPLGPIDQLDGAVVAQHQVVGDVADRRVAVVAADGEEQLVLGRASARRRGPAPPTTAGSGAGRRGTAAAHGSRRPSGARSTEGSGASCETTYRATILHVVSRRTLSRIPHLRLAVLAAIIGAAAGGAAWVLVHLIGLFTTACCSRCKRCSTSRSTTCPCSTTIGWSASAPAPTCLRARQRALAADRPEPGWSARLRAGEG